MALLKQGLPQAQGQAFFLTSTYCCALAMRNTLVWHTEDPRPHQNKRGRLGPNGGPMTASRPFMGAGTLHDNRYSHC